MDSGYLGPRVARDRNAKRSRRTFSATQGECQEVQNEVSFARTKRVKSCNRGSRTDFALDRVQTAIDVATPGP